MRPVRLHPRRSALMALPLALSLATLSGLAWSQPATYPARPVTLVVGSSPGSTSDGLARAIGTEWARLTGQPLVVDNKAGAFGGIAAQAVARATPDGYTLFITTNTTQAANPHLFKKLPYDPLRDFAPVAQLIQGNMLMVVHPSVKANTVAEFIALARKSPGQLNYGSGSSSARIAVEQFQAMTGVRLNHVPYKANPLAVMDLVAGQVDMMIVDLTTSLPQVKAGKLRALGVSSPSRSRLVPEVPTLAESGLPGYEAHHWNALYAPARTPQPVIARVNELLRQAMAAPAVRQFVEQTGNEVVFGSAADLARFQQAEYEAWGRVIKQAGIEPE